MASSIGQSTPALGSLTSYQKFVKEEGIDTLSGLGIQDLKNVPLKPRRARELVPQKRDVAHS
ncbi:MAG TPA: hypothetical protein VGA09_02555 [Candidatus Binatia bacterium]